MMNENSTKFLSIDERSNLKIFAFSIIAFFTLLTISIIVLPENCSLFVNDYEGGFSCDGIPNNCCSNPNMRLLSRSRAFLGLGIAIAPLLISKINSLKPKDEIPKLFK